MPALTAATAVQRRAPSGSRSSTAEARAVTGSESEIAAWAR